MPAVTTKITPQRISVPCCELHATNQRVKCNLCSMNSWWKIQIPPFYGWWAKTGLLAISFHPGVFSLILLSLPYTNAIEASGCGLGDFCYCYSNLITFMHNCSMASLSRKYFLPRLLTLSFSCRSILMDVPKVASCLFCFWLCITI